MRFSIRGAACAFALAALAAAGRAEVPSMINYQGRLMGAKLEPVEDKCAMRFRLYTSAEEEKPAWQEPPPEAPPRSVVVTSGVFNVLLGGYDPFNNPLPASAFNGDTWLEIEVNGETMKPRCQIVSVAYALRAGTAESLVLPFSGTASTAQPAFSVANKGGDAASFTGAVGVDGNLTVDAGRRNTGAVRPGLLFGPSNTGEGISSNRSDTDPARWGLDFYTNSAHRMTVSNAGNVGIGTRQPAARLEVANGAMRLSNTADAKAYEVSYDAAGDYLYIDEFGAGRHFAIKNGGNVGIGTTSPTRKLDVRGTARVITVDENAVWGESWGIGHAVYGWGNATGAAVHGLALGNGRAGSFLIDNIYSDAPALYASTNGRGYAGEFNGSVAVAKTLTTRDLFVAGGLNISNLQTNSIDLQQGTLRVTAANTVVDITATGQVRITTPGQVDISAGGDLNLNSSRNINIKASGSMTLQSSGTTAVRGSLVTLN